MAPHKALLFLTWNTVVDIEMEHGIKCGLQRDVSMYQPATTMTYIVPDIDVFWSSLDRWGHGTCVFVRLLALKEYVDQSALDELVSGLSGNIRFVKNVQSNISGGIEPYIALSKARACFPHLPWPKFCQECKQDRPQHFFPKTCTTCNDCGGSASRNKANRLKNDSVDTRLREASRKRQFRQTQGEEWRTRDAERKRIERSTGMQ